MRCFIAILILSGYCQLLGKKSYWNTDGDLGNRLVTEAMRRDHFLTIWRCLHCADNNLLHPTDKYYKLRSFSDLLRHRFLKWFVPEEDLNYDESMGKYFGKHACKQFIRGKPIRFGYKVWSLNTKSGYLVNFSLYQGKDARVKEEYQVVFGKCTAPLLMLLDKLPEEKKKRRYNLFTDNLFTSFHLLSHLKTRGYSSTGTIRII
ncbi:Transposase IS4 [Popillia japonica]|uniref:Transposase IS4 n=1 Tax=Popillia japonica TaxID=7064 RepID=A0AAW1L7H6_POPJA